jgi:hypothetical protein
MTIEMGISMNKWWVYAIEPAKIMGIWKLSINNGGFVEFHQQN